MAKQKKPIAKPFGTDGEGNIKVTGGPMVLDLGEFDDIFGSMDSESPKQGPLGEFYTGLKQSFSDRFKTKDIVRSFLRSAAPDGISNAMGFVEEAANVTRDIKDSLERTNAGDLQYIAKQAQQLLPKLKDYVSDTTYNDISQGLENKIDEYDYTVQSSRDQTAIRRQRAEQDTNNQIKEAMDNIALTERLNHNRSEKAAGIRHAQNRAENAIRDVLKTKRFDFVAKSMGMAVDGIQRIAGYNEQINYGFQRKGLELQFRSYIGIKELVKLQEAQLELNARAFNAMIRNTGMTDFQKSNTKGLTEIGRPGGNPSNVFSKAASALGSKTLSNFLGGHSGEVQSRLTNSLSQKLAMSVQALKMGQATPDLWGQKWSLAGGLAGDYLSDFVMSDLVPMLGREARPHLTKASNKNGGRHNQLGYYLDNLPAFMQEFVNNGQNQHGWKGTIRDLIAPYTPQFGLNDRLKSGSFQTIDQAAQFNQATQRTIVDAIPGYLARILQELRMVRTGSESVGREVFDLTTGKFTLEASAHDSLQDRIVPKSAIRSASTTINDALNTFDTEGKLSPKARQALGERLLRDSSGNNRFDPDQYIRSRGYAKGTDPEITDELDRFFRSRFEYDDKGKMADTADNQALRQEFSKAFLDIRSVSRDPIKEIERLVNTGHTEPLRAMGIILTENGQDRINYNRIWELLRSGVTDSNPYGPGGDGYDPWREDRSGTTGHRDFMGPVHPGMRSAFLQNQYRRFKDRFNPEEQAARDSMAKHLKAMRGRYSSASNSVKETFNDLTGGKGTDYTDGIKSYSTLLNPNGGYGLPGQIPTGYDAFVNSAVAKHTELKGYVAQGMQQLTDLYSSFDPTQPLIKGIDFGMGDLIDVNTKKIITKPSDITGEVINRLGQTVVTATEAAAGLLTPKGEVIVKVAENTTGIVGKALGLNGNTNASNDESIPEDPNSPEQLNNQDWSLGPGEKPVITARGIANGEYLDAAGKVLDSIADIASDIYDRSGNLVISAQEFANGLWSKRTGKRYRPTKGFAKILKYIKGGSKFSAMTANSLAWGALKFTGKAVVGIGSRIFDALVSNQNAYLPGERNPVFTRRALQNGEYYDDKGNLIENFKDVYSPIQNPNGEPIIPVDQYKDLVNFDGTKHILAKNQSIWAKLISRPIRAVKNAYMRATKRYYGWLGRKTKSLGGWLGRKVLGGSARIGGNIFNRMFEQVEDPNAKAQIDATLMASEQQTSVMEQVLEAIKDLKPKELRKGSWQEKAATKAANGATDLANKASEEKQQGFFKRGLAGIAGLLGFGNKDKNKATDSEEDEDESSWLSEAADYLGLGGLFGLKKKKGGRNGPKSKGLIGKGIDWAVNSKVGKWALGTAAGQAATGILTQVAKRPTLWTAIAATAIASGTYLWSSIKDSSGEFRRLRLAQYGIVGMRRELKVLQLEALLEQYTDKVSDTPSFSLSGAGAKQILDVMGIDPDDQPEVLNFAKWLELRFKPVYLAWIAGLNKVGQSQVKINDIDDKLPKALKADFLETIKFPYTGDTPYLVLINPFDPDDQPEDNTKQISEMFDALKAEYLPDRKVDDTAKPKDGEIAIRKDKVKVAGAGLVGAGVGTNLAKDLAIDQANKAEQKGDIGNSPLAKKALFSASMSGTVANLNHRIGNTVSALQAIRMRAYGLQVLHLADVRSLLSLEAVYAKDLVANSDVVDFTGDESKLLAEAGTLLGMDTSVGSNDRPKLYNWLVERFGPTFRAYYGSAKALNPSADLKSLESKLTGADKVTVAQAIMGAIYRHDRTVWECDSIFDVKGPLEDLKQLADADLEQLRKDSARDVVSSPTQKGSDQMAGSNAAANGGSFTDKVVGTIKDAWTNAKETVSSTWQRASDAVGNTVAGAKIAVGMGPEYGEGGASGGTVQSTGEGGVVGAGVGGTVDSIPYPGASGSIKGAYPTLAAVAKMTGVPLDWLLAIAGIESGFNYTVKASTSSATGWFQMINGTWDFMMKRCAAKYGIPADPNRSLRKDPRVNALLGAELIKYNWEQLKRGLGRDNLTLTDVYMAHFLGYGGALKFFKADPNAMAYKVFTKEYSDNMPLFFVNSKPSQPRTISQIYQLFQSKIDKFWNTVGKGYRQGSNDVVAEQIPQTVGAADNADAVGKATMEANLKADAKDKDSIANNGSNDEPAADTNKQSVQSLARGTAPMPSAPATGGGSSNSVSSTGTDSGNGAATAQQQAQLDAAQSQNARRQAEVKRDQQVASDINDIQTKQLNTLFEIRDLMRLQVDNSNDLLKQLSGASQAGSQSSGNNMNQTTIQGRPAAQRSSPLTLR